MVKVNKPNSFMDLHSDLCEEWDYNKNYPLLPSQVSCGSGKKVWWKCKNGHNWQAPIYNRSYGIGKCPECDNLFFSCSELMEEWDWNKNTLNPKNICKSSKEHVFWKCKKNNLHQWAATPRDRIYSHTGCPYCSGLYTLLQNSFAMSRPELLKEWNWEKNEDPFKVSVSSGKIFNWICLNNKEHEWRTTIGHRVEGNGCPYCSGRCATKDNNIVLKNPELIKEWNYNKNLNIDPKKILPRSGKEVWWECHNGHEWKATPHMRTIGNGCPYCRKIYLKNGIFCSSKAEAYYCIFLEENNVKYLHDQIYPGADLKIRYDFYLVDKNTYVEVTSYNETNCRWWKNYYEKILYKKNFVEGKLHANFMFEIITLSKDKIRKVREWEK